MKTILLNVFDERVELIDIEPELDVYYEKLDCRCIDMVHRKIGGLYFIVMCDDEGLFRDPQKISAINDMGEPMFVGNLMFFSSEVDDEGNLIGLTNEEIEHIKKNILHMYTNKFPAGYPMLVQCEYY